MISDAYWTCLSRRFDVSAYTSEASGSSMKPCLRLPDGISAHAAMRDELGDLHLQLLSLAHGDDSFASPVKSDVRVNDVRSSFERVESSGLNDVPA